MRRTYRSKKDNGGALDPRDVLQNMDQKSSAFDAFYIQNIKQSKRELSCVASSNVAGVPSNRVRKKKYVKRIVKDVEPVRQRETISSSAYLTPDKSIRVNKILDPFDMLLNSSTANEEQPKHEENVFVPIKESKTYERKRRPKVKKFNYSRSDSSIESDKENTNITDIRTHELLVEKSPIQRHKNTDESIQKIFNNFPLLCNYKSKNSGGSFNTSYKNKNRLSKAYLSPLLQKSPLCSTPFKEKYRGVSIFKFSPITQKSESPAQDISEHNDSNHSIILVSKSLRQKISSASKDSTLAASNASKNESQLKVSTENNDIHCVVTDYSKDKQDEIKIDSANDVELNEFTSKIDDSNLLQVTEAEPFLGFSDKELEDLSEVKKKMITEIEDIQYLNNNSDKDNSDSDINKTYDISHNSQEALESTQSECDDLTNGDEEELVTDKTDLSLNATKSSINTNSCISNSQTDNSDNESYYDTCNSDQSSVTDNLEAEREPLVVMERMNDSVFLKYYEKMIETQDNDISVQSDDSLTKNDETYLKADDDDFESLTNGSTEEKSMEDDSNETKYKLNPVVITDSSTTDDILSTEEQDNIEDQNNEYNDNTCVSFVTTRRRNEITKDSMFMFDQSNGSNSTDCDKTVLSNNIVSLDNSKNVNVSQHILPDEKAESTLNAKTDNIDENNISVAIRKSIKKSSALPVECDDTLNDMKLPEDSKNVRFSRMSTRKNSRLSRQSNASTISKDKSPTCNRISNIAVRKSSRLPKRSYSISSESENEKTIVHKNENDAIDKTVIDNDIKTLENKPDIDSKHKLSLQEVSIVNPERSSYIGTEGKVKSGIVLQPGKKWERSLSIYRRMTMADQPDNSLLEESMHNKGRKYRQSVISTMEMQEGRDSLHNDSINSRRSTFVSNPNRPTIRFVKDPNFSRVSHTSSVFDDLKGYLSEECNDTVIELSKLSIADSEHEVTVLDNFHETERVTTAKDFVLRRCNQTESILFDECYPETVLKNCHKIGEGVYGEVFLWRGRDGRARVMKVVPIAGTVKVNGEAQKDFHEIISEIVIAMELSALRAPIADIERQLDDGNDLHALDLQQIENATDIFNEVLAVRCVHGPYPSRLLDLWELYDECKGSENDNPAALPSDQRYIVLELANAGQDLESYQFASAQQAHALFQQIAFGLAVGEEAFQFEHRDLHWGNVLIAPTEQKLATFVLRGRTYRVPRRGVAATVIDYSLSRLSLPLAAGAGGECAALYNDLALDDQLFDAVGDYQFEVYRLMRDKLGNEWKNFEPYTNILWLHYVVDKMITALRYKRTNTKIHKHYIEKLTAIKNTILDYGSAVQFVLDNIDF